MHRLHINRLLLMEMKTITGAVAIAIEIVIKLTDESGESGG